MPQKNRVRFVLTGTIAVVSGLVTTLATLGGIVAPRIASAQDINTYYTVMHPAEFKIHWKEAYEKANELTAATRKRLPHQLDVAYGTDVKQRADIYQPVNKPKNAPVLIFLHGGGFREGDRAQYGYVAEPFAKHGIVTVVASYRLQPAHPWPAARDDAQALVAWVYKNIAQYGGDPNKIYLSGHSAGSILTAMLAYRDGWRKAKSLPNDVLKGVALTSALRDGPRPEVKDPTLAAETDVLRNTVSPPARNVLAAGSLEVEGEGAAGRKATEQMAQQLKAMGVSATVLWPAGLDHATLVLSLADEHSELSKAMLALIEGGSVRTAAK